MPACRGGNGPRSGVRTGSQQNPVNELSTTPAVRPIAMRLAKVILYPSLPLSLTRVSAPGALLTPGGQRVDANAVGPILVGALFATVELGSCALAACLDRAQRRQIWTGAMIGMTRMTPIAPATMIISRMGPPAESQETTTTLEGGRLAGTTCRRLSRGPGRHLAQVRPVSGR